MTQAKALVGSSMTGNEKAAAWAVIVVSAVVFFATAFSTAETFLKAIVILADLSFSGTIFARLTRSEGWYGVVMLRSKKGLKAMDDLARAYPGPAKAIADFGFTISYGLPIAAHVFRSEWRKLGVHAVLVAAFYWWLQSLPAANSLLNSFTLLIGLTTGLLGLGLISLISSTAAILTLKTAPSSVAPVIPGITIPLWEGLIALAIVVAVHELSHGILARVVNLKIHSSGLLLFGFLPIGAFVEPDERAFTKLALEKKRRILIAGTTSNFVFFLLFFALYAGASSLAPMMLAGVQVTAIESNSTLATFLTAGTVITTVDGSKGSSGLVMSAVLLSKSVDLRTSDGRSYSGKVSQLVVSDIPKGSPSTGILAAGDVIDKIGGVAVRTTGEAKDEISRKKPGEALTITLTGGQERRVTLNADGKLGISLMQAPAFAFENEPLPGYRPVYEPVLFVLTILGLTAFLSFALAIVNILPVFTTDGYRIAYEELCATLGKKRERLARNATLAASIFILGLLLVNLARWFKFF
jgi:membrane-associated protease RseP (regulator of RpoE activity)